MRFIIFGKELEDDEIEALKALIKEASGQVHVEVVNEISGPARDEEDDVILILGTPAVCGDGDLEGAFVKAANGARRTIWVWPQNEKTANLPAGAKNYAYSCIPWSADKLRAVVADDDVTCFETAMGEPLPTVETERNICVDEKTPAK